MIYLHNQLAGLVSGELNYVNDMGVNFCTNLMLSYGYRLTRLTSVVGKVPKKPKPQLWRRPFELHHHHHTPSEATGYMMMMIACVCVCV